MASRPLIKGKPRYTKRRLIIVFILCTILTVAVLTGFSSGLNSDSTIYTPDGDRIVMWKELPESGAPEDFDLLTDFRYAAQKIYTSKYFKGESQGDVVADVGMGIKYTQHVHNTRVVKDGVIFSEAISSSSLKNVADQRYVSGENVLIRPATSVSGGKASFGNSVNKISLETYYMRYGARANELVKYIVNNKTIKSVKDENAGKAQKNVPSDSGETPDGDENDEGEITFDVPQALVADEDGYYKFTLTLDPVEATKYYRNEVRTLASADENPVFYSVSITVTIDKFFNPVKVTSRETYDIAIPVLGAMTCSSTLTEVFTDIGDETKDIPDREFFESHIDDDNTDIDPEGPRSPADYLAAAFGDYLDGSKKLDLTADLDIAGVKIDKLKLSVDIATTEIRAKLGRLSIQYLDDKVYLTLNDIKGYMSVSAFTSLIDDPNVKTLMSGITLPDFNEILGGDILSTVFADCEMTTENGITCIRLPFELADGISVDASLYIADEGMELREITGNIKAFGIDVSVKASPAKNLSFPKIDASYKDLSKIADFVPAALGTALGKTYGIAGTVAVNDISVGIDAYIDREDGIKADAVATVLGQNIGIKYLNDTLYVSLGNTGVKATAEQIPALIDELSKLIELDTAKLDMFLQLLPDSVDEWIGTVQTLDVTDTSLSVGLNIVGIQVNIELTKNASSLTGLKASAKVNMLGIKLDAAIDLNITSPEKREVSADGSYIDATEITSLIPAIAEYINAPELTMWLDGSVSINGVNVGLDMTAGVSRADGNTEIAACGGISAYGQSFDVTHVNGTTYLSLGAVKVRMDGDFTEAIAERLNAATDGITLPDADAILSALDLESLISKILDAVKSVTVKDGVITAVAEIDGARITLTADVNNGVVTINGGFNGITVDITATVKTEAHTISAPEDASDYIDANEFVPAVDALTQIIKARGATATLTVDYGDISVTATVKANADGVSISVPGIGYGDFAVTLDAAFIGDTAYIALDGSVKLAFSADLDGIKRVLASLDGIIPADISAIINKVIDAVTDSDVKAIVGMIPAADVNIDVQATVDMLFGALKSLNVSDGTLSAVIAAGGTTLNITAATDLSTLSVNTVIDGVALSAAVTGITAGATVALAPADYVPVEKLAPAIDAVLPYALSDGITLDFTVTALGATADGALTVILPTETTELAASAHIDVGDVYFALAYISGNIYIDLNDSIRLSCGTSKAELDKLMQDLAPVLETLGGADFTGGMLDTFKQIASEPQKLLGAKLALGNSDNGGMYVTVDLTDAGLDITFTATLGYADGKLNAVGVKACALKKNIDIALDATTDETGKLVSLGTKDGAAVSANVAVSSSQSSDVSVTGKYVALTELTRYVAPLYGLATSLADADAISLNLDALLRIGDGQASELSGSVTVALKPELAVYADITMFKNTEFPEHLYVTYVGNTVYIKSGTVKLKFDAATDIDRLYDFLAPKLPEYLQTELAKLLGKAEGASAFSDISLLIERVEQIAAAKTPEQIVSLLLSDLGGLNKKSALKAVFDMISVKAVETGGIRITANVMGIGVNITPVLTNGNAPALASIDVNTTLSIGRSVYVGAKIYGISALDSATVVSPEGDGTDVTAEKYVSITEFTDVIDSAIGTFKTRDKNGNITFELTDVSFTYNEKDTVDEQGKTVVGQKVTVKNITNKNALRGEFSPVYKTDENGDYVLDKNGDKITDSYEFSLEAHISLTLGDGGKTGAIELELFITRDGKACLYYYETTTGYGERVYIDYDSVMEIVVAVLDIMDIEGTLDNMGVEGDLISKLIGQYRRPIDVSVFKSMDIVGLDSLRDTLAKLVKAIDDVKSVVNEVEATVNKIKTSGSIQTLGDLLPEIGQEFGDEIDKLKSIINALSSATSTDGNTTGGGNNAQKSVAELYKQIVNGISFRAATDEKGEHTVGADVNNSITVASDGTASIDVSQKNGALTRVNISGLDVDTALIAGDIRFTAGKTFDSPVEIPEDMKTPDNENVGFSDLSNIKHLLFDVMNTANLKEFNIGGKDTTDSINVTLDLSKMTAGELLKHLASLDISIKYNIQVKLIDCGTNARGKTIYKTAAMVELFYENCTAKVLGVDCIAIPDCVTRLYFFDNVFYLQGVSGFSTQKDVTVGTYSSSYQAQRPYWEGWKLKYETYTAPARIYDYKVETVKLDYVQAMYTIDEFTSMIKTDMDKFLKQFLFYLVPLSKSFTVFNVDLQSAIIDAIKNGSGSSGGTPDCTIAKVFKGYEYTKADGKHSLAIGLGELSGNSSLGDLNIDIVGKNDGDDDTTNNFRNNYISDLFIGTMIEGGMVDVKLNATLNNVTGADTDQIGSAGLAVTTPTLMNNTFKFDGHLCGTNGINHDPYTVYTLDGAVYKNGNMLYADHGTAYQKASYSVSGSSTIGNFMANPDYKAGDAVPYNDLYTNTLTKAYELTASPAFNADSTQVGSILDLLAEVTRDDEGKIIDLQNRDGGIQWSRPWAA